MASYLTVYHGILFIGSVLGTKVIFSKEPIFWNPSSIQFQAWEERPYLIFYGQILQAAPNNTFCQYHLLEKLSVNEAAPVGYVWGTGLVQSDY